MHVNHIEKRERGSGYWKFNCELLNNEEYKALVINTINSFNADPSNANNTATLNWDLLKMNIRRESISFAKKISRKNRAREKELKENLEKLEKELAETNTDDDNKKEMYYNAKIEYEQFETSRTRGIMLRAKARWIEEGEKNSKYFLSLENHNQEIKHIKTLINEDGIEITNKNEILDYIREYYVKLYSERPEVTEDLNEFAAFTADQKLTNMDSLLLDSHFTEPEIKDAVKDLPTRKTPGIDGFNKEFYEFFWDHIKDNFMRMVADVFINENLSIDQKRGIINLIPKQDKDLKYLGNWRPISILNTDYKIIAKVLANRIKSILPYLISEDQNGFVMGRLIGQNIRIVKDIMDYCECNSIEGLLVMLDFEKAFDSLNWKFLDYTLKEFNFGENYRRWVRILYNDISSSVSNNGHISAKFNLQRGIRQGCPLSAFVFILCAELLANKLKADSNIEGMTLGNYEYRILQFADDTALIIKDIDSLKESMKVLDKFHKVSGLKLNKKKTVIITLGNGANDEETSSQLEEIDLKLCTESFRYLGIYYDKDEIIMEYKNFRHRLEKIRNLLRIWLQRDLSLKGKITVIKTLALSQLIFPLSMLSAPKWVIDEADNLFLRFLWNDKPRKVKRLTTEKHISDGGMNMINVDYMARALKASWVQKIYSDSNNKWTNIPKLYFNDITFNELCCTRFDERFLPSTLPAFYRQCLIIVNELKSMEPINACEVKDERLWYNFNISIGGQPAFYRV
jgi:hypothetical protein